MRGLRGLIRRTENQKLRSALIESQVAVRLGILIQFTSLSLDMFVSPANKIPLSILWAIIKKDYHLFKWVEIIFGLPIMIVFLLTLVVPDWQWFASPALGISQSSLCVSLVSVVNVFLFPFAFYLMSIHADKQYGSFMAWRVLPITPRLLFWGLVLSCWLFLGVIPVILIVLFNLLHALGVLPQDLLAPFLRGVRFLLIFSAVSLLTSVIGVALAVNFSSPILSLLVAVLSTPIILLPMFFQLVFDLPLETIVVRLIQLFGTKLRVTVLLVALALLLGWAFSWLFARRRSYA